MSLKNVELFSLEGLFAFDLTLWLGKRVLVLKERFDFVLDEFIGCKATNESIETSSFSWFPESGFPGSRPWSLMA